jgi:hypothetical protein
MAGAYMQIVTIPLDRWIGHDPEYKYDERTLPIRYIVMHSTGGKDSRGWLSKWNKKNAGSQQNIVSIHYLVQRDGIVYRVIDEAKRAWHAGISKMPGGEKDGNSCSIGIELEHLNEPNYTEAQLDSAAELVHTLIHQYNIDGKNVVSHASIGQPPGRKVDPVHFDWGDFWRRVLEHDAPVVSRTSQEAFSAPAAVLPYSHTSLTLASPQINAGKLVEYLVNKHAEINNNRRTQDIKYTDGDIRLILNHYINYGQQVGVDYVFAISQMIHETGWLDSWWCARPRRNPAGIGVTGQVSLKDPKDPANWAQSGAIWKRGQSFASWEISAQHHLARLLCYALKDEEMTPEQLAFAQKISAPARVRGVAKQWVGFNGVWAVPGRTYAQKLATIANSFITASQ